MTHWCLRAPKQYKGASDSGVCTAQGLCSSFFPHSLFALVTHSAPQEVILWASSETLPPGELKLDQMQWQWRGDQFLLFTRVEQQHLLSAPLDSLLGENCGGSWQPLQSSRAKPSLLQPGAPTLETPWHSLHCIPSVHEALGRKQKDGEVKHNGI